MSSTLPANFNRPPALGERRLTKMMRRILRALPPIESLLGFNPDESGRSEAEPRVSSDGPTYRPRKPPVEIPRWRVMSGKLGLKPIKAEVEARVFWRNVNRRESKVAKKAARIEEAQRQARLSPYYAGELLGFPVLLSNKVKPLGNIVFGRL